MHQSGVILDKDSDYGAVDLPSVTQLLPKQNFFVSDERLEELAAEGTANHAEVEEMLKTSVSTSPLTDAVQKFINNDVKQLGLGKLLYFEQPLISEKNKFKGKPDMVFENGIVDLKRSISNKNYHALQLAGYELLCMDAGIYSEDLNCTSFILVATPQGQYGLHRVYTSMAGKVFRMLLNRHYTNIFIENYLNSQ